MQNPEIIHVILDNGDSALFVNADAVFQLDAQDSSPMTPKDIGQALAKSLGVTISYVEMDVPTDDDWSWSDVYELLPPKKKQQKI